MTQASSPVSVTQDITFTLSGVYFTDIYYGDTPVLEVQNVLQGGTNVFTSVQLQLGTTFSEGSILIGSAAPSGILQTLNLANRTVIDTHEVPELSLDNVEDFS